MIGLATIILIALGVIILTSSRDSSATLSRQSPATPTPSTTPKQLDKSTPSRDESDAIATFVEDLSPTLRRYATPALSKSSNQSGETPNTDEDSDDSSSPEPHTWTPEGRFVSEVFDSSDIDTQTISYGIITNYAGSNETLYMTVNTPKSTVDPETSRPLIIAITGGRYSWIL